jgi:hypothetical protein
MEPGVGLDTVCNIILVATAAGCSNQQVEVCSRFIDMVVIYTQFILHTYGSVSPGQVYQCA